MIGVSRTRSASNCLIFWRRWVLGSLLVLCLAPAWAYADRGAENFVQRGADEALASLNNRSLSLEARQEAFGQLLGRFADLPRISRFVLGRYARSFTPVQIAAFENKFRQYAIAVYAAQLDQFRGQSIRVIGSVDPRPNDSVVTSQIARRAGPPLTVRWRVRRDGNNQYRVVDAELGGVFLAIQQRSDFEAFLETVSGRPEALIDRLDHSTGMLWQQAQARDKSSKSGG